MKHNHLGSHEEWLIQQTGLTIKQIDTILKAVEIDEAAQLRAQVESLKCCGSCKSFFVSYDGGECENPDVIKTDGSYTEHAHTGCPQWKPR